MANLAGGWFKAPWAWMRRSRRLLALTVALALIGLRALDPLPVEVLRLRVFDLYQWAKPKAYQAQPVVVVDLDEASLEALGQWPWPRTVVAELVRRLFASGAVVVGLDVIFAEPDRTSPARIAETTPGLRPETIEDLRGRPDNDAVLAEVLAKTRVVLGQAGVQEVGAEEAAVPLKKAAIAHTGGDPRKRLTAYPHLLRSIPVLHDAAAGHGMISLPAEADGVVRRVPAVSRVGKAIYPALALEMLRVATGEKSLLIKSDRAGVLGVAVGKTLVPTDRNGRLWIHFTPHEPARLVSARDVLAGTVPRGRIEGKLVLVGSSAAALSDIKATPLGVHMSGIEIQAQILESVLASSFLTRPHFALGMELVALAFVCALIVLLVPLVGARWTLLVFAVAVGGMAVTSWYFYAEQRLLLDMAFPALATLLVYLTITYVSHARTEAERQEVRNAFGRYISPVLVERLADDSSQLTLGGESRDLTLLFCDIRGFTTLSENFDAQGLTQLINRFFTPMTDAILKWNGTVDKYMGDCVMAFWNAPLDDPEHGRHSCLAALDMLGEIKALNETLKEEAERNGSRYFPLAAGIGINSGECMVGNMGSDQRFDYSALGDPVNLASRLEGQTKAYGVSIIVGESTYASASDLAMLELDLLVVVGKTEPIRIYTILGDESVAASAEFLAHKAGHGEMLAAYREQRWDDALASLERCRRSGADLGLSGLCDVYAERIAIFKDVPPGEDRDGVFVATRK